jgi:hypothetical protein
LINTLEKDSDKTPFLTFSGRYMFYQDSKMPSLPYVNPHKFNFELCSTDFLERYFFVQYFNVNVTDFNKFPYKKKLACEATMDFKKFNKTNLYASRFHSPGKL